MKLCIDSNVFISIRNQEPDHSVCESILNAIELKQYEGLIPMIVMTEVLVGFYQIGELIAMEQFIIRCKTSFDLIPLSLTIAKEAAEIRAYHSIKLPDAIMIASAQLNQADYIISSDIPLLKKSLLPIISPTEFDQKVLQKAR